MILLIAENEKGYYSRSISQNETLLDCEAGPEFLAYYVPDNSIIVEEGIASEYDSNQSLVDYINQQQGYDRVIFDQTTGRSEALLKNLKQYQINFPVTVMSGQTIHWKKSIDQIVFFASEEVWSSLRSFDCNFNKTYKVSCLNANQWSHRILTYIALSEKDYFNDLVFTWGRQSYDNPHIEQDHINRIKLTDQELAKYKLLPKRITFVKEDSTNVNDRLPEHPAFQNTCLNIITETCSRNGTPSLTEKTFKPILAGQFFVFIGSKGCVQYLRDIGFDVFDDIIDHSYDGQELVRDRIRLALEQVDKLYQQDLFTLINNNKERLIKNNQWLRSEEFRKQFLPLKFK